MAKSRKEGGQINWVAIKSYYITHNVSYKKTAEKFGVALSNLMRHAKAEDWVAAKKKKQEEIGLKVVQKDTENQVNSLARLSAATDELLGRIEQALADVEQFNRHIITESAPAPEGIGTVSVTYEKFFDKVDTKAIRDLSQSLKTISELQGYMKPGEIAKLQLERERFEWEKAQAAKREKEEELDKDITIKIEGFTNEWSN